MTVKIRQTPISNSKGTFNVDPDTVRGHVIIIASGADAMNIDGNVGEDADPPDYTEITYEPGAIDTSTPKGKVKQRLKDLVDSGEDFMIHGVGFDFIWPDGRTLDVLPGQTDFTTVIYDTTNCNGDGFWIVGTNGDHECTPSVGILYHELAHAIRNPVDPLHPESEAIEDENDLREALGLVLRSTTDQQAGCECPDGGCCIVASVATGSEISPAVGALRKVRDQTLRGSRFGERFFDVLHREYYQFSVAVCRVMVRERAASADVERLLVRPLVAALDLAIAHLARPEGPDEAADLGRRLFAPPAPQLPREEFARASLLLAAISHGFGPPAGLPLNDGTAEVWRLLAEALPQTPHVRWAIVDLLALYVAARARFDRAADPQEVGDHLRRALSDWLRQMPVDEILEGEPAAEILADLARWAEARPDPLRQGLLRALGERLAGEERLAREEEPS